MRGLRFWNYKQPGVQELRDIDVLADKAATVTGTWAGWLEDAKNALEIV